MTLMTDRTVLPPSVPEERQELDELAALVTDTAESAALVGPDGTLLRLPPAVHEILVQVILAMHAGRAITIAPRAQRLTTQEAADVLGVSRPTLVKLLDEGKIPYEQPGRHRRVRLDDVLAYQEARRAERRRRLDDLVRESEDLGLYENGNDGSEEPSSPSR
ncbi:helix-turn-helix domain-containing protein [Streptomyces himalayensis]|uniref:Helix-turn-helix domain-containing protein n=1 Tax=Streptomyces himalayensis subsp. himalayensis TaxID=2756131 RepID=A0A7W0DPI9_9ACTN|nr:helix-turn-helix domain-containing protein [Streptomyces himalayensis]MBA2948835.1 helix-turn-helix domain-containing protein [Streptomyces himalayensis subsp. himalayensis]